jgi:hypothetical protein
LVNLSFYGFDIGHFSAVTVLDPYLLIFVSLSEMILYVGNGSVLKRLCHFSADAPVDFRFVYGTLPILAVFVCAVSHRIFSQNLKYIRACIPVVRKMEI